jgi:hypothetical protein
VLDERRYVQSILKNHWNLKSLFEPGSSGRARLDRCDAAYVVREFLPRFIRDRNLDGIALLWYYATERLGEEGIGFFNLAKGKPATQSSTSHWSISQSPGEDAACAVNGRIVGGDGFHTELDEKPWWCVDLEMVCPVREIRTSNRMAVPGRALSLAASASDDLHSWRPLYRHDGSLFGGADGAPLRIACDPTHPFRFLRLNLEAKECFHLEEVAVYL